MLVYKIKSQDLPVKSRLTLHSHYWPRENTHINLSQFAFESVQNLKVNMVSCYLKMKYNFLCDDMKFNKTQHYL